MTYTCSFKLSPLAYVGISVTLKSSVISFSASSSNPFFLANIVTFSWPMKGKSSIRLLWSFMPISNSNDVEYIDSIIDIVATTGPILLTLPWYVVTSTLSINKAVGSVASPCLSGSILSDFMN